MHHHDDQHSHDDHDEHHGQSGKMVCEMCGHAHDEASGKCACGCG